MVKELICNQAAVCDYPESECPHKKNHIRKDNCTKTGICPYKHVEVKCVPVPQPNN